MEKEFIDIKSDSLFPFHVRLLGIIFLLFGILAIISSPVFSVILVILGGFILSSYRGVEINMKNKVYRVYNSFYLLKFGDWNDFEEVEKIFINSSNVSQKIYTMITTGITARNVEYNAYIKFEDGTKIYLLCKDNKEKLLRNLTKISAFFQLEVVDHTL